MVSPEVFQSMYESVIREADMNIIWCQICCSIGLLLLAASGFSLWFGIAHRKKKEDYEFAIVVFAFIGIVVIALGGGINLAESEKKRNNPLSYIREKSEWKMLVVRPAEEDALRSIMKEYETRGLNSDIWTSFPTTPKSLPTQSQTFSQDSDPSRKSSTPETSSSE